MRFEGTEELKGAEFYGVDLSGAQFRNVDLSGAKIMEAMLVGARLSGLIHGLVVNDVEVAPLIQAELDRRYPERTKLRPESADDAREAWIVVEGLWSTTKARAGALEEETLHERVDGEWSFVETVRHLVFVTDLWIAAPVLGRTGHHYPFAMPPSFMTDLAAYGIDPDTDPQFADIVPVREERMAVVRALVDGLTDADLARDCNGHTLRACILTVLDEEWHHNWFAHRDLDVLTADARAAR